MGGKKVLDGVVMVGALEPNKERLVRLLGPERL